MDRSDDLLAGVVEQLPIGVFALGADGRVLLWNRWAERLTGWSREVVVGQELDRPALDAASVDRILAELAAGRTFTGRFPAVEGPTLYFRAAPATWPGIAALGVLQEVADSAAGDEAFALLDALWETAPVGLAYFDVELRYRRVNGAVLAFDGGTSDDRLGRTLEEVHGVTGGDIADVLRAVLADGRPRTAVPMHGRLWHGRGTLQEWLISCYPVRSADGETVGVGVVIDDVTDAEQNRRELERVAAQREEALRRFQSLVEATTPAVWVREVDGTARDDAPGLRAVTGQTHAQMSGWGWLDAVHPAHRPAWRAAWTRAVSADPAEVFTQVYRLRTAAGGYRWFRSRAVPVRVDGRVVQWVGTETDVEDPMRARDRLDVLAQATFAMNAAVEPEGELPALAAATVPAFADICRIYLLDPLRPGGGVTGRRSVSSTAPGVPASPMTDPRFVFGPEHPVAVCVRTAAPVLLDPRGAETGGWHPHPAQLRWAAEIDLHSMLVAPVLSGGTVVAVLLFVGCGDRPRYTSDDVSLVGELAQRASTAVGKATAYHQNRMVAVALQSAMLTEPPAVDGFEIEARYLPAAADLAVGGDWFDAYLLPDGDLAVGVGDVAGHDLPAATTMGQLRSMLRALSGEPGPPSAVVASLDRVVTRLAVTRFTTLVHGRLRRDGEGAVSFRWTNAGHPPPVLLGPDGTATVLTGAVDVVLGVAPGTTRRDAEAVLPTGSTLLLYTDGLVERRHDPDDHAGAALLDLVTRHGHRPLGEFCDQLVRDTLADTDDDIVVLAVRIR